MTIITTSTSDPAAPVRHRPPATAVAAGALSVLVAGVGGYGAVYFSGLEGWTGMTQTYVVTYASTSLFGLVAAIALVFGRGETRSAGRRGVLCYAIWLVGFSVFKMLRFQEWEAATFGVAGLVILALALAAPSRRWAH